MKLGKERAIDVFRRTQAKEESGGMNVNSNYRRRTPGGVYLFFAREILEADVKMEEGETEETKNASSESEDG